MEKKKHKKLWIVLVILAVLVVGVMMMDTDDAPDKELPATVPTEAAAPTAAATEAQTISPAETEAETEPAETETAETEPAETEPEETEPEETGEVLVDGMRPEFKEAMDSYEAFMAEYCDFMTEYNENPSDLKLLARYAELLVQYEQSMSDFDKWDDGTLNDAEYAYYVQVNSRVLQKLADVMASAQG